MLLFATPVLSCAICLPLATVVIVMVATAAPRAAILDNLETLLAIATCLDLSVLVWLSTAQLLSSGGVFKFGLLQGIVKLRLCGRGHAYNRDLLLIRLRFGGAVCWTA